MRPQSRVRALDAKLRASSARADRAIIATPTTFRDRPLSGVPVSVHRGRGGRRGCVILGMADSPTERARFLSGRRLRSGRRYAMYANTGMEPLMRSGVWPFAFYDVDNPDAMLAAIDQARIGNTW